MQALHVETDFNASGFFTINNSVSYNVKFQIILWKFPVVTKKNLSIYFSQIATTIVTFLVILIQFRQLDDIISTQ